MKVAFVAMIISLLSFSAFAKDVELGSYTAIDADTGTIVASLLLRADNTLNFKVKSPDFTMPDPGCEGVYAVEENQFTSDLKCPLDFLAEVHVNIDITNVTPESVRTEQGADVDVMIDALGTDAYKFHLKKIDN